MDDNSHLPRTTTMKRHVSILLLGVVLVISALRVGSTWRVFSQTYDEGTHIAAGMEWLTAGTYAGEPQHPPLARVATALGPFLSGARAPRDLPLPAQGNEILHSGEYRTMLALARAGILPFFLLSIVAVWMYARRMAGDVAAFAAAALYANEPAVLAHAGLATTDMASTAGIVLSLLLLHLWLIEPATKRAVLLGVALAIAVATKFSALLFLPVAGAAILICLLVSRSSLMTQRRRRTIAHLLVIGSVAIFAVWAMYRFSLQPLAGKHRALVEALATETGMDQRILTPLESIPFPATPLFSGIAEMLLHNRQGHPGYLLGEHRLGGWWYYFPVAFSVKTTLLFLIGAIVAPFVLSTGVRRTRAWHLLAPTAAALAILAASMTATINIGVRHLLPIYPLLAVGTGCAVAFLWRRSTRHRAVLVTLFLIEIITSARAHPDYLPYFNTIAGRQPERVLIDSNLDWGQDLLRLSTRARQLQIDALRLSYFGTADLARHDLPPLIPVSYEAAAPGWFAVSISNLGSPNHPVTFPWLDQHQPIERIGKSILLYRISPSFITPDVRAKLASLEPLIVPLQLGRTPGAGRLWVSDLQVENSGDREVQLQDAKGQTFLAEPQSKSTWELISRVPATLVYVHAEDEPLISGWVRVESMIDGVPQQDRVTVPLLPSRILTNQPIALDVPGCNGCRRTLRVYDSTRKTGSIAVTARQASHTVTRSLNLARTADPLAVAASAQSDLSTLFPELAVTESLELVLTGERLEPHAGRWAFVTLSGTDQHRVIVPR